MARPGVISNAGPPDPNAPRLPPEIQFQIATVDAFDFYHSGARIKFRADERTLEVLDRAFRLQSTYVFDEDPTVQQRSISGLVGGQPVTASHMEGCAPCQKYRQEPK